MISPELLHRYPFFSFLDQNQLKLIANISEDIEIEKGEVILREKQPVDALYLLLKGSVDLYYTVEVEYHPELGKELLFGVLNPGEPFGISALIEPHVYTATARASQPCRVIRVDASRLLAFCEDDMDMAHKLMRQISKAAMERLHATRLQLAAAWELS